MVGCVEGKIAVVTGGASGIGRACVERLAREGAMVVIADLQDDLGRALAGNVGEDGGRAEYRHLDVTDEAIWIELYTGIRERYGRLDILVNNAGIGIAGPITHLSLADWRRQTSVNLDGVFLGVKHAIPLMAENGGGSIINMSSSVGLIGQPMMACYSATKGGVRLFTKTVALECAALRTGIRVNSVHPGLIETPIWSANGAPDLDAMCAVTIPMGVKGLPVDIANGVLWLASDESRYVTGVELAIDGGLTAGGTGPLFKID